MTYLLKSSLDVDIRNSEPNSPFSSPSSKVTSKKLSGLSMLFDDDRNSRKLDGMLFPKPLSPLPEHHLVLEAEKGSANAPAKTVDYGSLFQSYKSELELPEHFNIDSTPLSVPGIAEKKCFTCEDLVSFMIEYIKSVDNDVEVSPNLNNCWQLPRLRLVPADAKGQPLDDLPLDLSSSADVLNLGVTDFAILDRVSNRNLMHIRIEGTISGDLPYSGNTSAVHVPYTTLDRRPSFDKARSSEELERMTSDDSIYVSGEESSLQRQKSEESDNPDVISLFRMDTEEHLSNVMAEETSPPSKPRRKLDVTTHNSSSRKTPRDPSSRGRSSSGSLIISCRRWGTHRWKVARQISLTPNGSVRWEDVMNSSVADRHGSSPATKMLVLNDSAKSKDGSIFGTPPRSGIKGASTTATPNRSNIHSRGSSIIMVPAAGDPGLERRHSERPYDEENDVIFVDNYRNRTPSIFSLEKLGALQTIFPHTSVPMTAQFSPCHSTSRDVTETHSQINASGSPDSESAFDENGHIKMTVKVKRRSGSIDFPVGNKRSPTSNSNYSNGNNHNYGGTHNGSNRAYLSSASIDSLLGSNTAGQFYERATSGGRHTGSVDSSSSSSDEDSAIIRSNSGRRSGLTKKTSSSTKKSASSVGGDGASDAVSYQSAAALLAAAVFNSGNVSRNQSPPPPPPVNTTTSSASNTPHGYVRKTLSRSTTINSNQDVDQAIGVTSSSTLPGTSTNGAVMEGRNRTRSRSSRNGSLRLSIVSNMSRTSSPPVPPPLTIAVGSRSISARSSGVNTPNHYHSSNTPNSASRRSSFFGRLLDNLSETFGLGSNSSTLEEDFCEADDEHHPVGSNSGHHNSYDDEYEPSVRHTRDNSGDSDHNAVGWTPRDSLKDSEYLPVVRDLDSGAVFPMGALRFEPFKLPATVSPTVLFENNDRQVEKLRR